MKDRNIEENDNWATCPNFYKKLNDEFNFDFDPCPINTGVISPDKDGLLIEWGQRNFINPPYSLNLKTKFVERAVQQSLKGKLCVLLVPVSTSTRLFHDVIKPNADDIRFVKGRIPFIGINSKGQKVNHHLIGDVTKETVLFKGKEIPLYVKNSGQHDSMIVVINPKNI
jgi:site-specific DNA-methyltransferase (adenine-specific)